MVGKMLESYSAATSHTQLSINELLILQHCLFAKRMVVHLLVDFDSKAQDVRLTAPHKRMTKRGNPSSELSPGFKAPFLLPSNSRNPSTYFCSVNSIFVLDIHSTIFEIEIEKLHSQLSHG